MSSQDRELERPSSLLNSLLRLIPGKGATKSSSNEPPPTEQIIQQWIIERIATAIELRPEKIDIHTPFNDFGLDSRTAVKMSGDLEKRLNRRLSPTLFWDFPTIESLAKHLHSGEPAPVVADPEQPPQWDRA